MSKTDSTVHVTGSTQDEINASFNAAKKHYTPYGEKAPSRGIMNRLYREAADARKAVQESLGPDGEHVTPDAVRSADGTVTETAKKPRSAAGAKKAHEDGKVVDMHQRSRRNGAEADKASDRVDQAIAEAKDRADDPYQTAMRNRREADRKRGQGRKVSDEELAAIIKTLVDTHPEYKVGQVWEVLMWTEKLAISRARFDEAWRTATGTEPTRRPMNRKAG